MNKEVRRFRPALAMLALAITQALALPPARAQVTPTPHGPGVDHAPNGVPVVNIHAPSAAGVSHNTYQHFNVDRQGLVLNNSGHVVATQQGGYIAGNPNITGNGARIILNEVTSTSRSQLSGFTEVAGRRAEVIIANPNGITCNGCGFINTSRGTLTTGTPVFGASGNLDALHVSRGDIRIEGEGLNASYTERLDLISRQVTANAKVWANELNVVAGANRVSRDNLATTAIAGEGPAPALAIDSAALGGMYANTIRLIATEAGVGVRNDGEVASAGQFEFNAAGDVVLKGRTTAGGSLTMRARSLTNEGTLAAQRDLAIRTTGDLTNNGKLYALEGGLGITSAGGFRNDGDAYAQVLASIQAAHVINDGSLESGQVAMTTGGFSQTGRLTGGHFDIVADSAYVRGHAYASERARWMVTALLDQEGTLASGGDLSIEAGNLVARGVLAAGLDANGKLGDRGRLQLASGGALVAQGRLLAAQDVTLDGSGVSLRGAQLRGSDITVRARQGLITAGADLATRGSLTLAAGGLLDNQGGQLQGDRVAIDAATLDNRQGSLVQTGATAQRLMVGGDLLNEDGRIASNAATLYLQAASFSNQRGVIEHAGAESVLIRGGVFDNGGGRVATNGQASFDIGALSNTGGSIIAGSLSVVASQSLLNGGTLQGRDAMALRTASLDNGDGSIKLTGSGTLDITAGVLSSRGFIGGNGAVRLQLDTLFNQGQLYAGTWFDAVVTGSITNRGAWQSLHGFRLVAGSLGNDTGVIEAGSGLDTAALSITAGHVSNRGGRIANAGAGLTTIAASGALVNISGTLGGQGDLILRATRIDNTGGTLVGNGDVTLTANQLDNTEGTLYAARSLRWDDGSATFTNTRGQLGAGLDLALALAWLDNAGGAVTAQNDASLNLGTLLGVGRVIAGQDLALHLAGDYLHVAGQELKANRNFSFDLGGTFRAQAGSVLESVDGLTLRARVIDNDGQVLASRTTLVSDSLQNRGRIEGDVVDIDAASIDNTGSVLGSDVTLRAVNLTNGADLGATITAGRYDTGLLAATRRLALYVSGTLLNRDAQIFTTGDLIIAANESGARAGVIINRSGSIEADGNLVLAAQQITNERRVFETSTMQLTDEERAANQLVHTSDVRFRYDDPDPLHHPPYVDPSQVISREEIAAAEAFCAAAAREDRLRCMGYRNGSGTPSTFERIITDTLVSRTQIDRTSAEGRILAGGDIVVSGSVRNDKSTLAAGRNLVINGAASGSIGDGSQLIGGERVENIGWVPTATVERSTALRVLFQRSNGGDAPWFTDVFRTYDTQLGWSDIDLSGSLPSWITLVPGQVAQARMTAGAAVDINGTDITLGSVDAAGNLINPIHLGANTGARPVAGIESDIGPLPGSQVVGSVDFPAGQITLPTGGLYIVRTDGGSPYLIETDPRFTSYGNFIGSDYLMGRLGWNGEGTLKRLGDAFYEQRMVLDQIASLTGRRFLTDSGDAMAEYRALMDSGVAAAERFELSVGVALTPEQMGQLTDDLVWLVKQNVDGHEVLIPVVYLSAARAASVATDGSVIAGNTVNINASGTLDQGGRVQASQEASLKAGNLLNKGAVSAGGTLSLSAAQDLLNTGSVSGGNVNLVAGRDLTSRNDAQVDMGFAAGGAITATGDLSAQAGRDLTLSAVPVTAGRDLGLAAGRDVSLIATPIKAGGDAQIVAGRDLNLLATGTTEAHLLPNGMAESTTHTVSTISAGGNALLAAGRDLTSQGAEMSGKTLTATAGRDLTLNAVTDREISHTSGKEGRKVASTHTLDETLRGTSLTSADGVLLAAGRDLSATAASVTSDTGDVILSAGRDLTLDAGHERQTTEVLTKSKKSGLLGSKTTTTRDTVDQNLAIGSLVSGDSVTLVAGRDLTTRAAQVGATSDVLIAAGNNLHIGTAESTYEVTSSKKVVRNGLMGQGGSLLIGQASQEQGYREKVTTPEGSLIGSTGGNVTLTAGNLARITGSDVLSATGTAIVGKDVTVEAALEKRETTQTQKQKSAGITVGISGAVANATQNAIGTGMRASEVSDPRLKALYAAKTAYAMQDTMGALAGPTGSIAKNADDIQHQAAALQIGIGASSASSKVTTYDETARGSSIRSAGDITIAATGGDLNIIGSDVAGKNVALAAANNLNVLSQVEKHTVKSESKNAGGGVGIQLGTDGFGIYVEASGGKSKGHGNGLTHAESMIKADNVLTLLAGNDATIKGAQLAGDSVLAAIGGNLHIESEQDTDDYASKNMQASGKVVFGAGVSGSASYSQGKVDSHYKSVNEISGISAGSGGFDITVGGNTHLKGGVIASTADASKNILDTGSLTIEHLENEAKYKASQFGISGGTSFDQNMVGAAGAGLSAAIPVGDKSSSQTQAGIAQGQIIVRDGPADLTSLDRAPTMDNQTLKPIFDEKKVAERMELGQVAGEVGMRAAGDLADSMNWSEDSAQRTLLHGAVAAATSALGGGNALDGALGATAGHLASGPILDFLANNGVDPNSEEGKTLMRLAMAAVGSAVGGADGGINALNGENFNRQLHVKETNWVKENAARYAAMHPGMSEDDALRALAQQAYRQVQSGASGSWDADASAFLKNAGRDLWTEAAYAGQTFLMFQADSEGQKADSSIFHAVPGRDWKFLQRNWIYPVSAESAAAWEHYRYDENWNTFSKAAYITGASVAVPITALRIGAAGYTSLTQFLAGPGGGAMFGGTINATSQYIHTGEVSPIGVGTSMLTGTWGAGYGLVPNVFLNSAGAGLQAHAENVFTGNKNDVTQAATIGAISALGGYVVGQRLGAVINMRYRTTIARINNPDWSLMNSGVVYGVSPPQALPYMMSNGASASGQQSLSDWLSRSLQKADQNLAPTSK